MIIDTEHLQLRHFDKKDINPYFNIAQGSGVKKYVYPIYVESKEKAKSRIEAFQRIANRANDDYVFAIEEKADNVLIGVIEAIHITGNTLDMSLFVAESCRNRGYAKEAVNALLLKLMEVKKSYKIELFVADDNIPAAMLIKQIKVEAEKLGLKMVDERFGQEGINYSLQL